MNSKTSLILLFFLSVQTSFAQQKKIPVLRAKSNLASLRLGTMYFKDAWPMSPKPEKDPESLNFDVNEAGALVSVITDQDSIGVFAKQGDQYLFKVILNEKDTVWAKINIRLPKANFTEKYKKETDGKTFVEVPKLYEMVNVIMAITPKGQLDSNMIEHEDAYYPKVQQAFSAFRKHRIVAVMDSLLRDGKYYDVKMDAYSFDFDNAGILKKKSAYNQIGWGDENTIVSLIPLLQDFAKKSNFLRFYEQNKPFYAGMIKAYRDSLGVPEMQSWLNRNFPATRYNAFKIIFSPLVSGDQSTTSFESNGFKEAQPHVNFPNFWKPQSSKLSDKGFNLKRGEIVFTELNHGFENPEFENKINSEAFGAINFNLAVYADKNKPAGSYDNALRCVEEYMNWALVSLHHADNAPKEDWETLFSDIDRRMVERRGFIKFKVFNRFLIDLYLNRPKGKVVADLYPQIIAWFKENNQ